LVLRLRAVLAQVPQTFSPFRTIFHSVEVPEQGDSIAPNLPKEMRSPFAALKKTPHRVPRLQAVNDYLQSLDITRRENQERPLATRLGSSPRPP
jgi:hypothetical protein